jgi:sugar-specific transcriptional regulator TrmB
MFLLFSGSAAAFFGGALELSNESGAPTKHTPVNPNDVFDRRQEMLQKQKELRERKEKEK